MKIGILATGHAPDSLKTDLGDYPAMFTTLLDGHGFTFETWDIENQQFPQSVSQADGWLITGSRHGVYENHPWIKPLETFVRQAYETHIPMVGVCFGHQIIEFIEGLARTRAPGVVPTDLIEAAYEALDNPIQNQVIAKRIADFFKLKRP